MIENTPSTNNFLDENGHMIQQNDYILDPTGIFVINSNMREPKGEMENGIVSLPTPNEDGSTESSTSSASDLTHSSPLFQVSRKVEPWTNEHEKLLRSWRAEAKDKMMKHERAELILLRINAWLSIPQILFPAVTTAILSIEPGSVGCEQPGNAFDITVTLLSALTFVIAGIHKFSSPYIKSLEHSRFYAFYADFVTDIDFIMSENRAFRLPAKVVMTSLHEKKDFLRKTEPAFPIYENLCLM